MPDSDHRRLIPLLGDQLTPHIASLRHARRDRDIVLMVEAEAEATYVWQHRKKVVFFLSAMRHFAADLRDAGWHVDYVELDDPSNTGAIDTEIERALKRHGADRVVITEPGEWRLAEAFRDLRDRTGVPFDIVDDDRFICSRERFEAWLGNRRQPRMEHFYRMMRRKTGLLMDGDEPIGGKWNYDADNRGAASPDMAFAPPTDFAADETTCAVIDLVAGRYPEGFGDIDPFRFAVKSYDAERAFDDFLKHRLAGFGDTQDAMLKGEPVMNHAFVALYINVGLLDPLDVCRRAEAVWRTGDAPLNAVEGFVRQILGWREYVRGIYWHAMPAYARRNHLGHTRPLPGFYWTGDTDMACIREVVHQTRRHAYAHHIQRLMVTGNFAMLAGVEPAAVHEWYLAVYADAIEWVELPNTLGMSQFADGGLMGSKPYAASANYINRMSNYCDGCRYKVKQRNGPDACPFNYLYWDFLARNRSRLDNNPRLSQQYRTYDRLADDRKTAIRDDAAAFLATLD